MKQNIYTQISTAVLSKKAASDNKKLTKACKNIPDYWTIVFTKAGIINDEISVDLDCFRKLETFTCELLEGDFNYYKIRFTFN
jgi:hypothetical protein